MRASTWNRRLESLWLARKRRSSNDILRNKIPYRFHPVSEFVFGTYDAAFVQAMYEDYLRDPASVGPEWRGVFGKSRPGGLPLIPTKPSPGGGGGGKKRDRGGGGGAYAAPGGSHPPP